MSDCPHTDVAITYYNIDVPTGRQVRVECLVCGLGWNGNLDWHMPNVGQWVLNAVYEYELALIKLKVDRLERERDDAIKDLEKIAGID